LGRSPTESTFDSELERPVEVLVRPALAMLAHPSVGPATRKREVLEERQRMSVTQGVERTAVVRCHRQREVQQLR
jgi:hypothetical protein